MSTEAVAMSPTHTLLMTLVAMTVCAPGLSAQAQCSSEGVVVQVLGSGGPLTETDRASSSYVVWVDGRSRVLVDLGGGAFLRAGQAGLRLDELGLVAISHFHPDHVADLPALLWLSDLRREDPLPISGPTGNEAFPSLEEFLERQFNPEAGAYRVLSGTVGGAGRGVRLEAATIDTERADPVTVLEEGGLRVRALSVPHANVPSVAYRVEAQGVSVVFSGDQTGLDPRFTEFARDANRLIMHLALSPSATGPVLDFHATPTAVGRTASEADVEELILSHFFPAEARQYSLADLDGSVSAVRDQFSGRIHVSEDLSCYSVR